jgi:hypothetical protein
LANVRARLAAIHGEIGPPFVVQECAPGVVATIAVPLAGNSAAPGAR